MGEGTRALSQGPCLEEEAVAEKTGEIAGEAVATMAPRQEGGQTRSPRAGQAVTCPLPSPGRPQPADVGGRWPWRRPAGGAERACGGCRGQGPLGRKGAGRPGGHPQAPEP